MERLGSLLFAFILLWVIMNGCREEIGVFLNFLFYGALIVGIIYGVYSFSNKKQNEVSHNNRKESNIKSIEVVKYKKEDTTFINKNSNMRIVTYTSSQFSRYISNDNSRIVLSKKGVPYELVPKGKFNNFSFISFYDEITEVKLHPVITSFEYKNDIISKDFISFEAEVTIIESIKDNENNLFRVVLNFDNEKKALNEIIKQYLKNAISYYNWEESIIIDKNKSEQLEKGLLEYQMNFDLCFLIQKLVKVDLRPQNKDIKELLEKRRANIEDEKTQLALRSIQQEREKLEKEHEMYFKIKDQEVEMLRARNAIQIEKERNMMQIALIKNNIEMLAILNPELFIKLKQTEFQHLKEKELLQNKFIQLVLSNQQAYQSGQINAVKAIAEKQFGIKLSDVSLSEEDVKKLIEMDKNDGLNKTE